MRAAARLAAMVPAAAAIRVVVAVQKLQSRRKRPQHYFHHSTKRLHKIRKSVTPSLSPFRTEKVLCMLISVLELQPIFSCNSRIPKKRTLKASNRLTAITQPQGRNKSCLRVRQEVTGSCAAAAARLPLPLMVACWPQVEVVRWDKGVNNWNGNRVLTRARSHDLHIRRAILASVLAKRVTKGPDQHGVIGGAIGCNSTGCCGGHRSVAQSR